MRQGPVALLRELPPAVQLLVAGTFVNRLGTFIVPFLSLVLVRDFGLGAGRAGLLLGAYGVGTIAAILGGGVVADRLGRRPALLLSLFGSGVLALAMGLAPSVRVFVPLLVLFGFLADLYRPAASSILGDLLPSSRRAVGFAALRTAINLGFAVGALVGGALAEWSWRLLFLGDGATTLLFGLIVWRFIPETRPAKAAPGGRHPAPESASPWRDGVFVEMAVASFLFCMLLMSFVTVLPLTVSVSAGYSARVYGALVALNGALIAMLELPLVAGFARLRRLRVAALGMLVMGVGFASTGVVLHWAWFLVVVLLWTAGEILSMPQMAAFVADWAPAHSRGRYLGVHQATFSLAVALNPVVFLPLHERLGERGFWPLMLLLALPGAWLLLHLDRRADHPQLLRGAAEEADATAARSAASGAAVESGPHAS